MPQLARQHAKPIYDLHFPLAGEEPTSVRLPIASAGHIALVHFDVQTRYRTMALACSVCILLVVNSQAREHFCMHCAGHHLDGRVHTRTVGTLEFRECVEVLVVVRRDCGKRGGAANGKGIEAQVGIRLGTCAKE